MLQKDAHYDEYEYTRLLKRFPFLLLTSKKVKHLNSVVWYKKLSINY